MKNDIETVCTCKIKENAELIARILDYDVNEFVFGRNFFDFVNEQREKFQEEYESYLQDLRNEEDSDKRFRLQLALGILKKTVSAFDDVLYTMEGLMRSEESEPVSTSYELKECKGK